ncbi:putative protein TPRXL [Arabidopsis lyrata subsp. lyrata]|uniref:putative protein TPRXL n=1 Tax=Arabidopsis lyrata subsp. lyrata TaxID=81972 RepID=UPI000A29A3BC|nr:putative protein TPRXL [Arabidopsis lyrata subsp. lyrata]|eukprot:XP_020883631.1 putative protein TPRXL [Arabidopsis lyrata subsp. lyrata]
MAKKKKLPLPFAAPCISKFSRVLAVTSSSYVPISSGSANPDLSPSSAAASTVASGTFVESKGALPLSPMVVSLSSPASSGQIASDSTVVVETKGCSNQSPTTTVESLLLKGSVSENSSIGAVSSIPSCSPGNGTCLPSTSATAAPLRPSFSEVCALRPIGPVSEISSTAVTSTLPGSLPLTGATLTSQTTSIPIGESESQTPKMDLPWASKFKASLRNLK